MSDISDRPQWTLAEQLDGDSLSSRYSTGPLSLSLPRSQLVQLGQSNDSAANKMTIEPISFTVREAQPSDADEIASLGASVFHASFAHSMPANDMHDYLVSSYAPQRIQAEIQDTKTYLFYVARHDVTNELLGFIQLNRSSSEPCLTLMPPQTIELQRIYTASKAHGHGVGSKLMSISLDYASLNGYKSVWLGVWDENLKAQKFYIERHGFVKVGEHDFTIGSCVQTDIIVERRLD